MAIIHVKKAMFEEVISQNNTVIFDFWAPWCAPFEPVFESLTTQFPNIAFCRINIEEEESLAAMFQVRSVPTIVFIREGIVVFSHAGFISETALAEGINDLQQLQMDQIHQDLLHAHK
ncbi:MAG: thioredoxin family protein [Thiomicrorhabdus sp.]|nr:thioredoxin family protein [Thiomicrorhabdus sp.]